MRCRESGSALDRTDDSLSARRYSHSWMAQFGTDAWTSKLVAALCLLLSLVPSNFAASSWCTRSFTPATCPDPPTFDSIDLKAYTGVWYEIGSTARFKLSQEGVTCVSANYTFTKSANSTSGITIGVKNRGVQVVGPLAKVGISQIDLGSVGACNAARSICSELGPTGRISTALSQVIALTGHLQTSSVHTYTAAISTIENAVRSLAVGLNDLESKIRQVQQRDSKLLQGDGKKAFQLQRLRAMASQVKFQALSLEEHVESIDSSRSRLISAAETLLPRNPFAAGKLTSAAVAIAAGQRIISRSLADIQAEMAFAVSSGSKLVAADDTRPLTEAFGLGVGVQNRTSPGKLTVHFMQPGQKTATGPYWIAAATGKAASGYDAALVVSCQPGPSGAVTKSVFVLSRKTTLPMPIVNRLLNLARNYGFDFDCENPFIFTVHGGKWCAKGSS